MVSIHLLPCVRNWHHLARAFLEGCSERVPDRICRPTKRIRIEVAVAICSLDIGVAEEAADDCKAHTRRSTVAREGVTEVMDADAGETGRADNERPWPLEITPVLLRPLAGNYIGAAVDPRDACQHIESRSGQDDDLRAGLGVRQVKEATLQIDVRPLELQDLAETGAGEDQEPDSGSGMWADR